MANGSPRNGESRKCLNAPILIRHKFYEFIKIQKYMLYFIRGFVYNISMGKLII